MLVQQPDPGYFQSDSFSTHQILKVYINFCEFPLNSSLEKKRVLHVYKNAFPQESMRRCYCLRYCKEGQTWV